MDDLQKCPDCIDGKWYYKPADLWVPCSICNGKGYIPRQDSDMPAVGIVCARCGYEIATRATGEENLQCPKCEGGAWIFPSGTPEDIEARKIARRPNRAVG